MSRTWVAVAFTLPLLCIGTIASRAIAPAALAEFLQPSTNGAAQCSPPPSSLPWWPNPSPSMIAIMRAETQTRAHLQGLSIVPSDKPYTFELRSPQGNAGPQNGVLPVRLDTLRFVFAGPGGVDESSHVRLLDTASHSPQTRQPCIGTTSFAAGIRIDRHGLPTGMYHLQASAVIAPFVLTDGDAISGATAKLEPSLIYIPGPPRALPQPVAGQRFLVLPESNLQYHDLAGAVIPRRDVAMRIATLARIHGDGLTFEVSGYPRQITMSSDSAITHIPGLPALVDEENLQQLTRRYGGRRVFARGGLALGPVWAGERRGPACLLTATGGGISTSGEAAYSQPYTVLGIFRIYGSSHEMVFGPETANAGRSTFLDESPLIVRLGLPAGSDPFSASSAPTNASFGSLLGGAVTRASEAPQTAEHTAPSTDQCVVYYAYFADSWDLIRLFSTSPPPNLGHEIKVGMSRGDVAWIYGYPNAYGTADELDGRPAWRYNNLPPFSYWVYFDRYGRVTKFGPDGQLP